jgi:replicative DNA helicase
VNALAPIADLRPKETIHPNHPDAQAARLPSNIDAEQALLGALLYHQDSFDALEGVEPRHFFEPFHARLFDAIANQVGGGGKPEFIIIGQKFDADQGYLELGGIQYLADLVDRAPPAASVPSYAASIIDLSLKRDLIRLGVEIDELAQAGEGSEAIIGHAESTLLGMQSGGRKLDLISAGAAAAQVLEYLDAPPGEVSGIKLGLEGLDEEMGALQPGNLILFMGRPSMGKSAAAECVGLNIAEQGYGVIQVNGEMTPEEMAQRHLTDLTHRMHGHLGPEYRDIRRRRVGVDQRIMLDQALTVLHPLPLLMIKRPGLKLSQLRSICRRQAAVWVRRGVPMGALIVDHAGLIKPDVPTRDRYADQTLVSNGMKELADELACPIIVLNQMNRENEKREDKRPQLSDLRDSGSWEQDADYVIGWYREAYYAQRQVEPKKDIEWAEWDRARRSRVLEAIILKARAGACLTVKLWCDVARNAIRDHAPEGSLL